MNLSFKTKFPDGTPTRFREKIWLGLLKHNLTNGEMPESQEGISPERFIHQWELRGLKEKIHTIRKGNRWKAGDKIEFILVDETGKETLFAPIIECQSVQDIEIKWNEDKTHCRVFIDKILKFNIRCLDNIFWTDEGTNWFIENDGLTTEQFVNWFNEDFKGQIIHWTDLRYKTFEDLVNAFSDKADEINGEIAE